MEFNHKKVIFYGIVWAIALLIVFAVLNLKFKNENITTGKIQTTTFEIWTAEWTENWFNEIINDFKAAYPKYKDDNIKVRVFKDYETYRDVLTSSFIKRKAPDIFVFNNSDSIKVIEDRILGIPEEIIPTSYMRTNFEPRIADDLIISVPLDDWSTVEGLIWVAPGYDTLVTYSNFKYTKWLKLDTWSWIYAAIDSLSKKYSNIIPVALWTWSTVDRASDIFSQFLVQDWIKSVTDIRSSNTSNTVSRYIEFSDVKWDNAYYNEFKKQSLTWDNSLMYFWEEKTAIAFWFIKDIETIKNWWISKLRLQMSPFPRYLSGEWNLIIDYNYYAINWETESPELAYTFIEFLATDIGWRSYMNNVDYKLPSNVNLTNERLSDKIDKHYNAKYWSIYETDRTLVTFNKLIESSFDRFITDALDRANPTSEIPEISSNLICKHNQVWLLTWFETKCF